MLDLKMHPPDSDMVIEDVTVDNSDQEVVPDSADGKDRGSVEKVESLAGVLWPFPCSFFLLL